MRSLGWDLSGSWCIRAWRARPALAIAWLTAGLVGELGIGGVALGLTAPRGCS
jgi:hypothetical protein